MPSHTLFRCAAVAALLCLGACADSGDDNLAALDNELLANGADPALTSALEDQILVDPNLVQQAHPNTVRPPETPMQAQYPAGSAREGAAEAGRTRLRNASGGSVADPTGCGGAPLDHGRQWANRLPREFPPYPGGRVTEAAGSNSADCRMRVVTFRTEDTFRGVLEHYRALASRAGYSAEHQVRGADHVLGGVNESVEGAFYLIVTPLESGSDVALIVNNGS